MLVKKTIIRWWHQLSSTYYFEKLAKVLAPWCWAIGLLLLLVGCVWGLFFAPEDYQQKDAFRIIYVHVPTSVMSMGIYVMMAVSAAIYYIWHIKLSAYICRSSALLGAVFTFLALFTGSVWGKPMWGAYWTWDARLTSELLLFFLYVGYMALVSAIENETLADKIGSVLLVVGVVNIPVIHYSVVWWNSLHQGATIMKLGKPSISTDMLWPLLINLLAFSVLSAAYIFSATRAKIIEAKNDKILLENLQS